MELLETIFALSWKESADGNSLSGKEPWSGWGDLAIFTEGRCVLAGRGHGAGGEGGRSTPE